MRGVRHDPMLYSYLLDPTYSSHRLAEVMYQRTAGPTPPGAGAEPGAGGRASEKKAGEKKEEEVIDAEYVDMDGNK